MTKQKVIRALLINPPIYDNRFDWARWHQPCGLLQIASLLRAQSNDVRLIDCLQPLNGDRTQRRKLDSISIGETELPRWSFGLSWDQIDREIKSLKEEKWNPDAVYITCMMTFWWEGARDLIKHLRTDWFPKTRIFLGGVYPNLCPEHVRRNFPGVHFDLEISNKAKRRATDFEVYSQTPRFAGILLGRSSRVDRIAGEMEKKAKLGVREFAFFDEEIGVQNVSHFENVLDQIIEKELDIKLRALGNLSPEALTPKIVRKMRKAGYRQVFLRDNIALKQNVNGDLSGYERGIELLLKYGDYKPRTEDITAMVLVGVPGENLDHVVERLTRLAHVVGSVNLVPYQPTPGTKVYEQYKTHLPPELEKQNGKLFPFAKVNHASFSDYQQLTRLAALLNSKYHSTTFDFLGDDEISKMVRQGIAQETWKPKLKERIPLLPR